MEFNYVPNKRKPRERPETPRKRLKTATSDGQRAPKYSRSSFIASGTEVTTAWSVSQLLAEIESLHPSVAENIVQLLDQDNTIPFICRYRRHLVDNLEPDRIREIKTTVTQLTQLRSKVTSVAKSLEKENLLTNDLRESICKVKSMDELNHIYDLYKPARKKSLVEKATNLELSPVADLILSGEALVNFSRYVDKSIEPLMTESEVKAGVAILVSSMIMKNAKVLNFIREKRKTSRIELISSQTRTNTPNNSSAAVAKKFELYFNFKSFISQIRPHQVLAINRGEKNKILTVKIAVPEEMQWQLVGFVLQLYSGRVEYRERTEFLKKVISDMYNKKVVSLITKEVRRELTEKAEKASIEVFANNLRQLLLTCPVKGEKILGIDPGFSHGCKLAMISEQGIVLETTTVYPHTRKSDKMSDMKVIADMLRDHRCRIVALGNGTACRETEALLLDMKKLTKLDFNYCITSEQGASVYSCSNTAKREFPRLDVNLISAVSIARRLSNPLAELVKVEPRHLGVGMYQHDVTEKQLAEALQEIVVECVSFVGVDINTASETLLQFISGLTPARARNIIEYRQKNGCIGSREELKKIKLIGEKTFKQCAGFVRVEKQTSGAEINPLDATWVHPESYYIARAIMKNLTLEEKDIGRFHFVDKVKEMAGDLGRVQSLSQTLSTSVECVTSVCEALKRMPTQDYRDDLNKRPHFKQGLTKMSDLTPETVASGSVTNVTHFGCFVDLGVEQSGLIHTRNLKGMRPRIGDSVEVTIMAVDEAQGRISLRLEKIL